MGCQSRQMAMIFVDIESLIPETHLLRKIERMVSFDLLDAFICPEGVPLTYHRLNCSKSTGKYLRCYQVEGDFCMRCPKRSSCFDKAGIRRRVLASSCYPAFFRGHQRVGTPEYLAMMRLRKIWAEGSFSVLKREHCISRIRKRGILAATEECLLAAMALNLKRMVNAIFRYPQIYCSAGTTVGFSRIFMFVNRSLILQYPAQTRQENERRGKAVYEKETQEKLQRPCAGQAVAFSRQLAILRPVMQQGEKYHARV